MSRLAVLLTFLLAAVSGLRAADHPGPPLTPAEPAWEEGTWQDGSWIPPADRRAAVGGQWLTGTRPHHTRPLDEGRYVGLGQPLQGTSWLNRPWYAGCFMGPWWGDTLITDRVDQGTGYFAGYWLGLDLAHYWGSELRFSYFYTDVEYLPSRYPGGSTRNLVGDLHLLYYPWGDARWRPYASLGLGLAGFHFIDDRDAAVNHTQVAIPWGFGVKYQSRRFLALRLELTDNLVFSGSGVNTTNNWSVVGGVEVHWGRGSAASYYPW